MIDCGLQICSKGGCMYRADVDSGAVRIGLLLWSYRALFVDAQSSFDD